MGHVVICMRHRIRCCAKVREPVEETADGDKIEDLAWRAPAHLSCWEKAHLFYLPRKLFHDSINPMIEDDLERDRGCKFQCMRVGSEIYKQRNSALGIEIANRGRKKKQKGTKAAKGKRQQQKEQTMEVIQDDTLDEFGTPEQGEQRAWV